MHRALFRLIILVLSTQTVMAANTQEVTVNDPVLGARAITYEQQGGYALVEGDIILGRAHELGVKHAAILPKVTGGRWPHGIVPFEFSADLPADNLHAVLYAMYILQKQTNIKFIVLNDQNKQQYPDYLVFLPATGTTCASEVGKKGGRQEIILAPRCNAMNNVHEIMHALGFWHEQSRQDRDSYVRIVWENIAEDHIYNFNQHLSECKDYGNYDYQSIMHYPANAFSKNGKATIVPLQDKVEIGQRNQLSPHDILAINAMYPEGED